MIGTPVAPLPAPLGLRGLKLRAVAIQPQYLTRLGGEDLNVVTQSLDPAPGQGFDLVIATNILVYYSRFEQALAMANIAHMMNAEGIFLANSILPAQRPESLAFLGRRNVSYAADGSYGDDIVAYRKRL